MQGRFVTFINKVIGLFMRKPNDDFDSNIVDKDLLIQVSKLIRHFKFECKDDWFPDTLLYKDYFKTLNLKEYLLAYLNDSNYYKQVNCELFNLPKKGFTIRYALELPFRDRFLYHALISQLIPSYDKLFSPRVLSHRYNSRKGRPDKYLYKHPIEQWKTYENYVRSSLESTAEDEGKKVLLETDLANYFENIRINDVIRILRSRVNDLDINESQLSLTKRIIDELEKLLPEWCFHLKHGLSQNRDASSFLANVLMSEIDSEMIEVKKYDYYRYMDDIRIVCKDKYEARKALKSLIIILRRFGLNVNSSKTKILSESDEEYIEFVNGGNRQLERLDSMWKSKSLPVIKRSFPHLKKFMLNLISEGKTQDRAFRFCIKRFEILALCKDIIVPDEYFSDITDVIIGEINDQPYTTDQFIRYLKAVNLSSDQLKRLKELFLNKNTWVYGWQVFLLWQLFVYKSYKDEEIKSCAINVISDLNSSPIILSGAVLYIGAIGDTDEKINLSVNFKNIKSYLAQRNALIALQSLDYKAHIKDNVEPYVHSSLKGTYRNVKEYFPGIYYSELESVSYKNIYNEFSHYE